MQADRAFPFTASSNVPLLEGIAGTRSSPRRDFFVSLCVDAFSSSADHSRLGKLVHTQPDRISGWICANSMRLPNMIIVGFDHMNMCLKLWTVLGNDRSRCSSSLAFLRCGIPLDPHIMAWL